MMNPIDLLGIALLALGFYGLLRLTSPAFWRGRAVRARLRALDDDVVEELRKGVTTGHMMIGRVHDGVFVPKAPVRWEGGARYKIRRKRP